MHSTEFELDKNILETVTKQDNIQFLVELNLKQKNLSKDLSDIERVKAKIIDKISKNKQETENQPKESREYISVAESVLESLELVYKNLIELQNRYRNIEKSLVIISERSKINTESNAFKDDLQELLKEIDNTKEVEQIIEKDNEKNYLIINSFLDNSANLNYRVEKTDNFERPTQENLKDNLVLKICEKRVELPYTKQEVEKFLETYPDDYKTVQDVILKEFTVNIAMFNKHPILSRFREGYYLCRNKEMMSIFDSFNFAKGIMFRSEINPYIVAAVKSKKQLLDYIECLENNRLDDFPHFKIIFEVNPLKV